LLPQGEDLLAVFVQEQVVITEVMSAHVPVESFGLDIECEYVGK